MADEKTVEQGNERTFTQAELDGIVGERLNRERAKYADYDALKEKAQKYEEYEEAQKTELQKAQEREQSLSAELERLKKANEVRETRDRISKETGVPVDLLTFETEEDCRAQAERLIAWRPGVVGYPQIRDGGEPQNPPKGKKTTRELFAEVMASYK